MNLQIGTILIAKEDRFMDEEKANPWAIKENPYKIIKYRSNENDYMIIDEQGEEHYMGIDFINQHFTIKRYTLQDLQTRTDLMVRIENEEQAKKLQDAGLAFIYKSYYEPYYGFTEGFIWLTISEQQGRILLESIDEIDLGDEGKEKELKQEAKLYPFYYYAKGNYSCNCAVCKQDFQGDKRAVMCLECAIKQHHIEIDFAYSEIARLKAEKEELKKKINLVELTEENTANKYSSALTEIAQLKLQLRESPQISPEHEKRERMAWELVINNVMSIDNCFLAVDLFLAKSKEVKDGE